MKIAYILGSFPSISETFVLREMLALGATGIEPAIFALWRPDSVKVHDEAKRLLDKVNYPPRAGSAAALRSCAAFMREQPTRALAAVAAGMSGRIWNPLAWLRALRMFSAACWIAMECRKAEVVHVHAHFAYMPTDAALMAARLMGTSFSFSAHAWDVYTQRKAALRRKVREAAFVAACTLHGRDYLRSLFPEMESKIVTVRHGVFTEEFKPGTARENLILGVGRLEPKKGFRFLVQACAVLKNRKSDFRCVIAGDGAQRRVLEDDIRRMDLAGRVELAGALTQSELKPLYGKAAVFALPSVVMPDGDRDGLPNAIVEAMAMGVPVVSTAVGAIPEAIGDGVQGFLVAPCDPDALARRIEELLADGDLRERLGREARRRALDEYDVRKNAGELASLFRNARHDRTE